MPAERYGLISKFHHSSDFPILSQSTIACALEQHLLNLHKFTYRLDGDNVRFGLNKDLGFDEKSRNENIRRIGEVSKTSLLSYWLLMSVLAGVQIICGCRMRIHHRFHISLSGRQGHSKRTTSERLLAIRRGIRRCATAGSGGTGPQRVVQKSKGWRNSRLDCRLC